MNWSRRLLALILTAVAVAACAGGAEPTTVAAPPAITPHVVSPRDLVPLPGVAAPSPEALAALVKLSPCDILPDTGEIVGQLAHDRGYPRWTGEAIVFDSATPQRTPDPFVVRALTGGTTYENEVHDCQRLVLIAGVDSSFGPLIGLLPLDQAMELADADFTGGRAVGTVYNWGDTAGNAQPYDPLTIGHRWNCLWLRPDSQLSWRAALTADAPEACYERSPPAAAAYTLDVQRALHPDAIPKTARWGWHAVENVHIMGVKCGSAWCWVGPKDLWAADTIHLVGDAHTTIPGYFDEQHLAVPGGGWIKPGPIGLLTPSQQLYYLAAAQRALPSVDLFGLATSVGLRFAKIELPGVQGPPPIPYDSIWGIRQTPVPRPMPVTVTLRNQQSTFRDATGGVGRSVTVNPLAGGAHAAVGAVRWRWHDTVNTESIWSACGVKGTDCCDTQ